MSLRELAKRLVELTEHEYEVLSILDRNMKRFGEIPYELIKNSVSFSEERLEKALSKLHSLKLVWCPRGRKVSYLLNYSGLDALALRTLVEKGIVAALGNPIGVGKEADVYEAVDENGRRLAVKFFRIGRTSFKKYVRLREALSRAHNYMEASKKAAFMEFKALTILSDKAPVPIPVYRTRHAVITEIFEGVELASVSKLENPEGVLSKILDGIEAAYMEGVVHRDLSAYNILISPSTNIMLIDWPQWVDSAHPNAQEYLRKDVENIMVFFRRKWHIKTIPEKYEGLLENLLRKSIK